LKITVKLYGVLRDLAGRETLELSCEYDECVLYRIFEKIVQTHPELKNYINVVDKEIYVRGVNIIINGRHIMFYDINEIVKEDLLIDILPPVSGGS